MQVSSGGANGDRAGGAAWFWNGESVISTAPSIRPVASNGLGSKIRIPKAAELVADTLRRRIILGEYTLGELLPPEGTLMQDFDVARTTVRDAFRVLESE